MMPGMTHHEATKTAIALEDIKVQGAVFGLTSLQVGAVVDPWLAWFSATGRPVDISTVRLAIMDRVIGKPCLPPPL